MKTHMYFPPSEKMSQRRQAFESEGKILCATGQNLSALVHGTSSSICASMMRSEGRRGNAIVVALHSDGA